MVIVALGLLGLILGSFVNALVWRQHEQEEAAGNVSSRAKSRDPVRKGSDGISRQARNDTVFQSQLSIWHGRSMCPDCHHTLAARDLVPVFSWLALRGRCRYCHRPISWQYPLVELLTAGLFVWSYAAWSLGVHGAGLFQLIIWLAMLVAFVALAVYDLRWFELPDRTVFPLVGLALVQVVVLAVWQHSWSDVWQPALGVAVLFGLFWLLFQVSKGTWIGGGDVKLALALGLIAATPLRAFLVLFIASLVGTLVSLPLIGKGRQGFRAHIPFGPYLLLAALVVQLYGTQIIDWYRRVLLV